MLVLMQLNDMSDDVGFFLKIYIDDLLYLKFQFKGEFIKTCIL